MMRERVTMRAWCLATGLLLGMAAAARAGARIELRPDPDLAVYEPHQVVRIHVYMVDTGNPQGDISFRGIQLDFTDTTDTITPLTTIHFFEWMKSLPGVGRETWYPITFWIWPLVTPMPMFMITLPDNGEVHLGYADMNIGPSGGMVDVLNADEPNINFGAFAVFGFGGPDDPVTTWRAFTGELVGEPLALNVPEPSMLAIGVAIVGGCFVGIPRFGRQWGIPFPGGEKGA
jgi:hypothetical protein